VVGELTVGRADLIRTLRFERPGDYYGSRGGGIGQGLPGAIGYKLAQPDRPLLAISGDGSSLYSLQALWTAAHYRLPIVFVILNDRAYSIVKLNLDRYRAYFGRQHRQGYPCLDLTDPDIDFVRLAQGLGVPARRITEPDQLGPAIQAAFDSGGPCLIEVPVEGFACPPLQQSDQPGETSAYGGSFLSHMPARLDGQPPASPVRL
jgi:benzoylformate decarboxylase